MNKEFFKATGLYIFLMAVIFGLIWLVLDLVIPDAQINMLRALSTAFGLQLPDNFLGHAAGFKATLVLVGVSALSIALIILNVYFGAIVTSHFIRPRVLLVTSAKGVLSNKWNALIPYVLVRLANFHRAELVDVKINIMLTIEEVRNNGIKNEPFICYLPVKEFTPPHILVMRPKMPWTIAIPADTILNSTLTKDYRFKPGEPILHSFSSGKTLISAKRTVEILLQGTDTKSYSSFTLHKKILIDEQNGSEYTLHLHKGAFKSLPLEIKYTAELNEYAN